MEDSTTSPALSIFGFAAFLFLVSASVSAFPVTINSVGADWINVVGGADTLNYVDTDGIAGNEEIQWGIPAETEKSGFRFDSATPPGFTVNTGDEFTLGLFTHTNQPIWESIGRAQLSLTSDLVIGGMVFNGGPFVVSFAHNETTNACEPLPDCANDIVSIASLALSHSFLANGIEYTLDLIGFSVDDVVTTEFSTVERKSNTAQLRAVIHSTVIAEPLSITLFGLGLVGVAFARRRR